LGYGKGLRKRREMACNLGILEGDTSLIIETATQLLCGCGKEAYLL
jgi:hypothetical protein